MSVTVLFVSAHDDADAWRAALAPHLPGLDFRVWPDEAGAPEDIDVAVVWKPPPGLLAALPNLKAIVNLGAGVDALLGDDTLPDGVPVVRLVDDRLTQGMTEYVVYGVLHFHRGFPALAAAQRAAQWKPVPAPDPAATRVGILGVGELGRDAARALARFGFAVAGWSRTAKSIDGVESFAGAAALGDFLARTDILVCLLPLTAETDGILNAETLARLPRGACVINAARGGHVVEDDLLAALDSGHVAGAMLDVFREEPLPADHPFWTHPAVVVTPHIASLTIAESAAPRMADNIRRALAGQPLPDAVDKNAGY